MSCLFCFSMPSSLSFSSSLASYPPDSGFSFLSWQHRTTAAKEPISTEKIRPNRDIQRKRLMKQPLFSWYPSACCAACLAWSHCSSLRPSTRSSFSPEATRPALEKRQKKPRRNQAAELQQESVCRIGPVILITATWFFSHTHMSGRKTTSRVI